MGKLGASNLGSHLKKTVLSALVNDMQVAEIYRPLRVVKVANQMGLRGGWSLDFITQAEDGMPWDSNDA